MFLAAFMSLVLVNQVAALVSIGTHAAGWFAQISLNMAMAYSFFTGWRGSRHAGKHLSLFGWVLFLILSGLGAFRLSTDPMVGGMFLVPGAQWIALGLGLALGGFIVWVFRRAVAIKAADTTVETADYSWVNASHGHSC